MLVTNQESAGDEVFQPAALSVRRFEGHRATSLSKRIRSSSTAGLRLRCSSTTTGARDEATKAATTFLDGRGFGYAVDRFVAMPLMMEIMPLCHGYDQQIRGMLQRQEVFTSKYLPCRAIYGPWKGNSNNPVLVGYSREGQIISIDPFKTNASFNIAIAARSGAGKSVLAGNLVKQLLTTGVPGNLHSEDGGQVFAIDSGALTRRCPSSTPPSTLSLAKANPSQSTRSATSPASPMMTNSGLDSTMDNGRGYVTLAGSLKLTMISNILKLMAAPDGNMDNFQMSVMSQILLKCAWIRPTRRASPCLPRCVTNTKISGCVTSGPSSTTSLSMASTLASLTGGYHQPSGSHHASSWRNWASSRRNRTYRRWC